MPYEEGSAVGVHDFAGKIRNFLLGYKAFNTPSFVGTGDGKLEAFGATDATAVETWTITCTDATTAGSELWSVVGSTSGNIGTATSYTLFDTNGITFIITPGVTNFAVSDAFTVVVTGTGAMTTSGDAGVLNEISFNPANVNDSYLYVSIKLDGVGTDDINIYFYSVRETLSGDYRIGWLLGPSYDDQIDFFLQPNQSNRTFQYCRDNNLDYWMNANSYAIVSSVKSDTNFHNAYIGFFIPYSSPNAYPFPGFVGASANRTDWLSTTVDDEFRTWPWSNKRTINNTFESAWLYLPDGTWLPCVSGLDDGNSGSGGFVDYGTTTSFSSPARHAEYEDYAGIMPWCTNNKGQQDAYNRIEPSPIDGNYVLFPIEIAVGFENRMYQIYGKFRFTAAVFGSSIGSEDIVQADGSDWIVVQDIFRNTFFNHMVIRKD